VKETYWQQRPQTVARQKPEPAQGGELRACWAWGEAKVESARILKAPETGIAGGDASFFCADSLLSLSQAVWPSVDLRKEHPPTGEPDAGNLPVRFGRGGGSIPSLSHQQPAAKACLRDKQPTWEDEFSSESDKQEQSALPSPNRYVPGLMACLLWQGRIGNAKIHEMADNIHHTPVFARKLVEIT
jgi:hypothetical protein